MRPNMPSRPQWLLEEMHPLNPPRPRSSEQILQAAERGLWGLVEHVLIGRLPRQTERIRLNLAEQLRLMRYVLANSNYSLIDSLLQSGRMYIFNKPIEMLVKRALRDEKSVIVEDYVLYKDFRLSWQTLFEVISLFAEKQREFNKAADVVQRLPENTPVDKLGFLWNDIANNAPPRNANKDLDKLRWALQDTCNRLNDLK